MRFSGDGENSAKTFSLRKRFLDAFVAAAKD
jgi:hypothetical protein